MNLKMRYASSLFLVILLLALFTWAAVYCLTHQYYLLTALIIALLYGVTFLLGKRLSKVFFTLSFLQHMRKKGGVAGHTSCIDFIGKSVGKRRTEEEVETLAAEILDTLLREKVVEIYDNTLILIDP